jgi:phosphotriesterase-related protein
LIFQQVSYITDRVQPFLNPVIFIHFFIYMLTLSRREFLAGTLGALLADRRKTSKILTVKGWIPPQDLGLSLIHEHFLVDFIGADKIHSNRWKREEVVNRVLPLLFEAREAGVKSIFDCTPAFLGRDPALLAELSERSELHIVTNTGYYGARENKYLPPWAFTETAEQLAARWTKEFEKGIDGTAVKPGFIKIGVDSQTPLSVIHQKLVKAAALTHLRTGLTICSHTGPAAPAVEQLEILKQMGVHSSAFVWVHAQAEKDKEWYYRLAQAGAWVSLDGIGWGDYENYADSLVRLKAQGLLHRVLISHDSGWFKPEEPEAPINGYTAVSSHLLPMLVSRGFTEQDKELLLNSNPAKAFATVLRKD